MGRNDIVVLLRQVRDPRPPVRLTDTSVAVKDVGVRRVVNPADLSAVEVAVSLAEGPGLTVTAVAIGNETYDDALRLALSMGATRAVRVWDDAMKEGDAVAEARVLRRVLEVLRPSLLCAGSRLLDRGDEPAPALAAAALDLPCAGSAVSLELRDGRAEVVRKVEKGARQRVSLSLPCAVLFDATAAQPRYPDLPAVLRSMETPVELWGVEDLGLPAHELGLTGSVLRPAGLSFPRSDPLRLQAPDPSLPAHLRVQALFSGGIKPRGGRIQFGTVDETVKRILAVFAEEGLVRPDSAGAEPRP